MKHKKKFYSFFHSFKHLKKRFKFETLLAEKIKIFQSELTKNKHFKIILDICCENSVVSFDLKVVQSEVCSVSLFLDSFMSYVCMLWVRRNI